MYESLIEVVKNANSLNESAQKLLLDLIQQGRIERDLLEAQYAILANPKATILFSMEGFIFYKIPWDCQSNDIAYSFVYRNERNEWRKINSFTDTIEEAMALYLQIKTFGKDRITFADLLRPLSRDEKHDRIK